MISLYFVILILVFLCDVSTLLLNPRPPSLRTGSRYQFTVFDGQTNYDPFESDSRMRAMMIWELSMVKQMNSSSIKLELTTLGYVSKGLVDKSDLEKYLARKRVTNNMQKLQVEEESAKAKGKRADLIEDEIRKIQSSGMTELSMVNELHSRNVKIDVADDLTHQLALSRLGISIAGNAREKLKSESRDPLNDSEIEKAYSDTLSDLKGAYSRFVQNVEGIVPDIAANIESLSTSQAATETLKSVQDYASNIGLTKMEQQAQILTSGRAEDKNKNDNKYIPVDPKIQARVLKEGEILDSLAAARGFRTFDEIVYWAKNRSRSELAQLLEYLKETVPKYAPRSALAAIFADSLLVDRSNHQDYSEEDDFGRNFVANSKIDRIEDNVSMGNNVPWEVVDRDNIDASAAATTANPAQKKVRKAGDNNVKRKKYDGRKEMTSFFFERELFQKFSDLFSNTIKNLLSQETLTDMQNGETRRSFTSFTSRLITLGCRSAMTAASWAGGRMMTPSHVLFVATAYSLLTREGIWSFLGSFLVIRLIREMAFVRDSFTDQPAVEEA